MRLDKPLTPGSTIGILGGGQLGRMLALAAGQLGLKCHILAPQGDNPAFQVADSYTVARYDDEAALAGFAKSVGVVTYEFENVPAATAAFLDRLVPLAPNAQALEISQDRLTEKTFISTIARVAPFAPVDNAADLTAAIAKTGSPGVLKTRRLGYDGKGQARFALGDDAEAAFATIGRAPAILEGFVSFEREISVIAARSWSGEVAVYDVPENQHENHILRHSIVPAKISKSTAKAARDIAAKVVAALDYVGVIGVEMFVGKDEGLLVNEIAPRVHNSGHWTMDACAVSQFEQHIRAVAGWPLGDPSRHSDVVMTNLLGAEADRWREIAAEPGACLHLYGKSESRPGRKMGHVNRLALSTG
ncbi:MAG: 5-(carboxyamino)imidazole ribonucleotide synthase [Hyphomicrobiales bacterium]